MAVAAKLNQLKFSLNQSNSFNNMATDSTDPRPILIRKRSEAPECDPVSFSYIDLDKLNFYQRLARRDIEVMRQSVDSQQVTHVDNGIEKVEPSKSKAVSKPPTAPRPSTSRLCQQKSQPFQTRKKPIEGPKPKVSVPSTLPARSMSPPVRDTDAWQPDAPTQSRQKKIPSSAVTGPDPLMESIKSTMNAVERLQLECKEDRLRTHSLLEQLLQSSEPTSPKTIPSLPDSRPKNANKVKFQRRVQGRLYPNPNSQEENGLRRRAAPSTSSSAWRHSGSDLTNSQLSLATHSNGDDSMDNDQNAFQAKDVDTILLALRRLLLANQKPAASATTSTALNTSHLRKRPPPIQTPESLTTDLPGVNLPKRGDMMPNIDQVVARLDELWLESEAIHKRWPQIEYEDANSVMSFNDNVDVLLAPHTFQPINDVGPLQRAPMAFTKGVRFASPTYVGPDGYKKCVNPPSKPVLAPDESDVYRLLNNRDDFEDYLRHSQYALPGSTVDLSKICEWFVDDFIDESVAKLVDQLESASDDLVGFLMQTEVAGNDSNSEVDYESSFTEE